MRRRPLLFLVPAAALVLVLALAGIATAAGHSSARKAASRQAVVTTRKTKPGMILVDAQGRTLYLFEKDKNGKSACAGACAKAWPPLMTSGKPKVAGGANAKMLGTTHRASGLQVTYNGHPLYLFFEDKQAGQTNGQGSTAFGAPWYVMGTNGNKITKG